MARMNRYQMAIRNVVAKDLKDYSKNEMRLIDYASDVDQAEEYQLEACDRMADLFKQDIERVSCGQSSQNPAGYSCSMDSIQYAVRLDERAKALRYMVRLVLDQEGAEKFEAALELVRKTQVETLHAQKEAAKRGPKFSSRRI